VTKKWRPENGLETIYDKCVEIRLMAIY